MLRLAAALGLALVLGGCPSSSTTLPNLCTDAGCQCSSDSQCAGATPRCDVNAGMCVPCLPVKDNCPAGQHCMVVGGTFTCGGCQVAADCPAAGQTCCAGACIDIQSDPHNCGGCANNCQLPANAQAGCTAGKCGIGACNPGFKDCDNNTSNGCEINSDSDGKNCGTCGMACTHGPNQTTACMTGGCVSTCAAGWSHCSATPSDGCEVHTDVDLANCGGCRVKCGPLANAAAVCKGGVCGVASCGDGFGDCDGKVENGCETNLKSDLANCSACGKACGAVANGAPACQNGFCAVGKCNAGWADCDGLPLNGCETDITQDAKNCAACGRSCSGPQSMQICQAWACVISACTPGFADCDHVPESGCEVSTSSDVANCGMCGNACAAPANATPGCVNATCGIGQCNPGFVNCNQDPKDGCEINQLTDVKNCGGCANQCMTPNATPACSMGKCAVGMCNLGFGDCNKQVGDGCEVNQLTDAKNCGACGKACALANSTPACMAGGCVIAACTAGFSDCDGKAANGCEVNLNTDAANCGKCGTVCPNNTPDCIKGICVLCLSGGMAPPAACDTGTDAETASPYVVCKADCNSAYVAANVGGGNYHADQICKKYGYSTIGSYGGTCGTVCGFCQQWPNPSCLNPQDPPTYDGGGKVGQDQFGIILGQFVQWQCLR